MRRESGWWVVAYTEMVCRTAALLLFDVYDSLRLWWVPQATIDAWRNIDLVSILGSQANVDELLDLLRVVKKTHFYNYRQSQ